MLTKFIRNITTHCYHIPDDYMSCVLKSPNMYDSIVRCDIAHPERSCLEDCLFRALKVFNGAYKPFLIANLIPVIMYKRNELRTNPKKVLYRLCISIFRSFIFCFSIGCIYGMGICGTAHQRFDGTKPFINYFLSWTVSNLGIFAESRGRIEETFLYLLVNFFQLAWNYLKKKYSVKAVPMFTNFLFALTTGLFYSVYVQDDGSMKSKYKFVCDQIFSIDKKPNRNRTEIEDKD